MANTYHSATIKGHSASSISKNLPANEQVMSHDNEEEKINSSASTDKVSISDAAQSISRNSTSTNYYMQFMSTYEGFSSANIASGVSNPSDETFSSGKDFKQVAIDARTSLNKNYEKLDSIGKPYTPGSTPPKVANSLLGELDRRALYAVSSNRDGIYTENEQNLARHKMK